LPHPRPPHNATLLPYTTLFRSGLLRFPASEKEQSRFLEIQTSSRQYPDPTLKHEYLARVLNIWKCTLCGTYHPAHDSGEIILSKRNEAWLQYMRGDDDRAIRYLCESCSGLLRGENKATRSSAVSGGD